MRPLIALAAIALLAGPAVAQPSAISVTGAWTRPAAGGLTDAGYLTITNRSKTADRLLSATSAQAGKIEMMRSSITANDISTMKAIEDGLELAPGQTVKFEPGGYHLMLEDLKHEQKLGAALPVTLTFAKAGKIKVTLAVASGPPNPK